MKKSTALALATSLVAGSAFAANTSATSVAQVAPKLTDKLIASYSNVIYGPSLSDVSAFQPDLSGTRDDSSPIAVRNFLTAGYKLNDRMTVAGISEFYVYFAGKSAVMKDPYLRLSNSKVLSRGNFNLYVDGRFYAPISTGSRAKNQLGSIASKQVATYGIPNSRFTLGLTTVARAYAYGGNEEHSNRQLDVYAGPQVEYQILPNLTAFVLYEAGATQTRGMGFDMVRDGTDLEPGVSWDVTPNFNVSPYLDIKSGGVISTGTTQLGANITWKLL